MTAKTDSKAKSAKPKAAAPKAAPKSEAKAAAPKEPKAPKVAKAKKAPSTKRTKPPKARKVKYEVVKKTDDHVILKKKSGRYAVRMANRAWLRGADKVKLLVAEGLIKTPLPKAGKEAPAPEAEAKPAE
jgi:hypothetical protein